MTVFSPNLTSRLVAKIAARFCHLNTRYLEVGCGSGYITRELLHAGRLSGEHCWLSDISEEAVLIARSNLDGLIDPDRFIVGPGLEPWQGHRFDLIVSDVSGISEEVAQESEWYVGVPTGCGLDGLVNTLEVVSKAGQLLLESGVLVFPVISLSDTTRLMNEIRSRFAEVELQQETKWPLPESLTRKMTLLETLQEEGKISFEKKYGKILATTAVAVCSEPIV